MANDELENFICQKYNYDCKNCTASLYNMGGSKTECSFDVVNECLQEYLKEHWGNIIDIREDN